MGPNWWEKSHKATNRGSLGRRCYYSPLPLLYYSFSRAETVSSMWFCARQLPGKEVEGNPTYYQKYISLLNLTAYELYFTICMNITTLLYYYSTKILIHYYITFPHFSKLWPFTHNLPQRFKLIHFAPSYYSLYFISQKLHTKSYMDSMRNRVTHWTRIRITLY